MSQDGYSQPPPYRISPSPPPYASYPPWRIGLNNAGNADNDINDFFDDIYEDIEESNPQVFDDDLQGYFVQNSRETSPQHLQSDASFPLSPSPSEENLPFSDQQAQTLQEDAFPLYLAEYQDYPESPDPFEEAFENLASSHFSQQYHRTDISPSRTIAPDPTVVDLTDSPPIGTMPPIKRKRRSVSVSEGRSTKAARLSTSRSVKATRAPKQESSPEAEVVNLVDLDEETEVADFIRKQQEEAIKQQHQDEASRPVKLAEFQCIICMDNPTDLTVTHCGHLFCSECLHQAMYAGNAKKTCPVCRSAISVPVGSGKKQPKNGVFVLEMKLMTAKKKGKQVIRGWKS